MKKNIRSSTRLADPPGADANGTSNARRPPRDDHHDNLRPRRRTNRQRHDAGAQQGRGGNHAPTQDHSGVSEHIRLKRRPSLAQPIEVRISGEALAGGTFSLDFTAYVLGSSVKFDGDTETIITTFSNGIVLTQHRAGTTSTRTCGSVGHQPDSLL